MSIDVPERRPEQVRGRWRNAVAVVCCPRATADSAQLGDHPERLLDTRPLTRHPGPLHRVRRAPEPPLPGQWPLVRGGDPACATCIPAVEGRRRRFPPTVRSADTNAVVLAALGEGVSALLIRVGSRAPDRLTALLSGVYLNLAPASSTPAPTTVRPATPRWCWNAQLDPGQRRPVDRPKRRPADGVSAIVPPRRSRRSSRSHPGRRRTWGFVCDHRRRTGLHNLARPAGHRIRGHRRGRGGLPWVLTESGLVVRRAAADQLPARRHDDQSKTLGRCGLYVNRRGRGRGRPGGGAAVVHAETSLPMMTQRDPWVNMLRCIAKGLGKSVARHRVGALRSTWRDSRRLSRHGGRLCAPDRSHTQLLLLEESHVGRVPDPAGGRSRSWLGAPGVGHRGPWRLASGRPDRRAPPAAPTTRPSAPGRSPASTNTRTWRTCAAAR